MRTASYGRAIIGLAVSIVVVAAASCGGTTSGTGQIGARDGGTGGSGTGGGGGTGGVGPACVSASQCPVPAICKLCPDGTSRCATASCVNGHCVTSFGDCTAPLEWWVTCGYPVCGIPGIDAGTKNPCSAQRGQTIGAPCTTDGAECDYDASCGTKLLCATSDPTHGGMCPISRARYKEDIRYLSPDERSALADELQSIPLARYRYKDAPEREHLGFIIEDIEPSPSVDSPRDRVDLYGYTSMAVAALQQQHEELAALRKQVRELEARLNGSAPPARPARAGHR